MLKEASDLIRDEDLTIAPYGVKSSYSGGRIYPEKEHIYRLPFQRDKDRIVHSRAFKRLEYKTQVFINSEGDNYRTRLTHTLEVAGISGTIATSLGLNIHLSECIALAHDLGHTPFGHAGQDILSELMKPYGGFEHNKQSLRIVQKLENRYPNFPGLNLTIKTLQGIMKHGGDYELSDVNLDRNEEGPSLESLVTDYADEIAYNSHDIEDGIEKNLISLSSLNSLDIWKRNFSTAQSSSKSKDEILIVRGCIRQILNEMTTDLLLETEKRIQKYKIFSTADLTRSWKAKEKIVSYSKNMQSDVIALKKFLLENLYKHAEVLKMTRKGQNIIEKLFFYYSKFPEKMPKSYLDKISEEGTHRIVSDYIAGMTDRYAESVFDNL
ncbi:MAG: deoxyguanosinetriphosphate triphosphohydrolase [Leptospiraceae bacterium]|nr:deoxyguanosinetriphosphate triphosphohydrolase [Leptospiraceae bacterium]MCK6380066.1 deoxyguanosinetriphosphate triphosphohydrolase [Leptospiraceae bacterium]NUM42928.1 deoxyguanosinetriphosphate triphosphohydrolase [Leptospiraceae bacterium]